MGPAKIKENMKEEGRNLIWSVDLQGKLSQQAMLGSVMGNGTRKSSFRFTPVLAFKQLTLI